MKTDTEKILEMLFNIVAKTHSAIDKFKSNRDTYEKAKENMDVDLKIIINLITDYFKEMI